MGELMISGDTGESWDLREYKDKANNFQIGMLYFYTERALRVLSNRTVRKNDCHFSNI